MADSTPEAPAWNVEHTMEKKPAKWNYIDGCMVKAILDLYRATGVKKYYYFAQDYIDFFLRENGEKILGYAVEEYNCDNINMGKALFDLYAETKDAKYKNAIALLQSQMQTHPRINAGNFWHKKIYPNQVWLDGLYMVQPFLTDYEMIFGNQNAGDIFKQFETVAEIMRDPKTGLFYHGYDESREMFWANGETGLSKNFWTRSIGWFTMALVDTAEKAGGNARLAAHLKNALDALLKVADPATKMFFQVTDAHGKAGNYLETSGSCAIAYSLMKGARLGYLPPEYYNHGKEIFDSVVKHKLILTDSEFALKDICLVAGLGGMPGKGDYQPRDGTYEYYISEPKVDNDAKGVAPFLFSYAEVLRKEG
jgi:unsaturated rhamnogalacturonyl hydrolase